MKGRRDAPRVPRTQPLSAAGEPERRPRAADRTAPAWGVVGGGILGMFLAWRLAQHGARVTLLDRAPAFGGLAGAWRVGDITWDRHYHVTLLSDRYTRGLLSELELEGDMRWVQTRTGFFTDGAMHPMSSSVDFLRFPPLGLVDKLRLALTILYASRVKNWKRLERVPVVEWLRRWSGARTVEKIWLPLLRAKLGESYRDTSAAFIWATIARMYAARRTGLKKEMFGYLPGGYGRILEAFSDRLSRAGVDLRPGTGVRSVRSSPSGGVTVTCEAGPPLQFDRALLTVASPVAARLCPDLTDDERTRLNGIRYQGIVCASVLLKRPLAGYYITNITEAWVPFTAVIEMSALVDPTELGGHTLVYLPKYLASDDAAFRTPDEVWQETMLSALFRMYPDLRGDDVLAFRVSRARFVHALSTMSYSDHLPPRRTSIPGVHIVNSSHIVNGTLNVNETLKLGEEALPSLLADHPAGNDA